MGLPLPAVPDSDPVALRLVAIYHLVSRERRYVDGTPLPLAVSDITAVMTAHPSDLPRWLVDMVIFEIDKHELDKVTK